MTISSLILGASGIILTFAPDVMLNNLGVDPNRISLLLIQIIGGLYFGYAMLNWMTKGSLIGGIYSRPIVIANLTHFLIVGLAMIKVLMASSSLPLVIWLAGIIYMALSLLYAIILFTHPVTLKDKHTVDQ